MYFITKFKGLTFINMPLFGGLSKHRPQTSTSLGRSTLCEYVQYFNLKIIKSNGMSTKHTTKYWLWLHFAATLSLRKEPCPGFRAPTVGYPSSFDNAPSVFHILYVCRYLPTTTLTFVLSFFFFLQLYLTSLSPSISLQCPPLTGYIFSIQVPLTDLVFHLCTLSVKSLHLFPLSQVLQSQIPHSPPKLL